MTPRISSALGIFLFAFATAGVDSQARSADERRPIAYRISFPAKDKHVADIEMTVPTDSRESVDLMMAVWSPGFYRVENYASRVRDVTAKAADGTAIPVEQPAKNRWRVKANGAASVVVSYRLACEERSVTTNWVGEDFAILNGPATFMTLVGHVKRPHDVRLDLPTTWKSSFTGLAATPGGQPHHYRADDFDALADSPIVAGNPAVNEFDVAGSRHYAVHVGDHSAWDRSRSTADLEKIVREHQRMWGILPFKKYVFLFAFRPGGGGLEHANSTLVTTGPAGMRNPKAYQSWLGLVCHEYFHAFNVKRLRPVELGPFDYETGPKTSGLWVAEGLTVYYDQLLLTRAGLQTPGEHLASVSSQIGRVQTSPGRLVQSLEKASEDVWTSSFSGIGTSDKTISYYVKGPVVGFLLDAKIRRVTGGGKSLDDVMRLAFTRYGGERGYTADQFRAAAEEIAGTDLTEWFRKTIRSTEELDYADALEWFGLRFSTSDQPKSSWKLEPDPAATKDQLARLVNWQSPLPAPPLAGSSKLSPVVAPPPEVFFEKLRDRDRDVARRFYKKHVDVGGLSVVAAGVVADEALLRTHHIVTHMLAGRPDILAAMAQAGTRLIVIGKDQVYTDMPEYRNHPNPVYQNERVRGTGGLDVTSFGEENLLNLAGDRYDDESIAVHEFCHTIDAALRRIDPTWRTTLNQAYQHAMKQGLWKMAYASGNPGEYWAEICQSYFDCNRINNWNHASIGSREQLKQYDPEGYELVRRTFRLTPETDWRYRPLRTQPSVIAPPARYKIDPYYTKFTFAREFPVVGSARVRDEALLAANDTVRKMFAYRHDLLKSLIADGAKLVVLAPGERVSDLPEFKNGAGVAIVDDVRFLDYAPSHKLMVVPEENVLGRDDDPFAGKGLVVGLFAKGVYHATATRPVDPEWDRRREKQQYELRVKRLDIDFDATLKKRFDEATEKGLWKGTPAARDRVEYWAAGVEAYFDATGAGYPPNPAARPITNRESLKGYDPDLFSLVDDVMAFSGHVDWRFRGMSRTSPPILSK